MEPIWLKVEGEMVEDMFWQVGWNDLTVDHGVSDDATPGFRGPQ